MYGFGHNFPVNIPFKQQYKCYSVTMMGRQDVERGGKIIMPPSALDALTRLHIQYPMLFKLTNNEKNKVTHCGVLEFVADEGRVYIPYWMMQNLLMDEGAFITVENVSLEVATFTRFRPLSVDFLDITNPKAVLENALRNFACLTVGDTLVLKYNDKDYELNVLETRPGDAVSIIECDMNVDFAPPVGYEEPRVRKDEDLGPGMEEVDAALPVVEDNSFKAFSGSGNRLDGKKRPTSEYTLPAQSGASSGKRGHPNYNYQAGTITFIRNLQKPNNNGNTSPEEAFQAFSGEGKTLKSKLRK